MGETAPPRTKLAMQLPADLPAALTRKYGARTAPATAWWPCAAADPGAASPESEDDLPSLPALEGPCVRFALCGDGTVPPSLQPAAVQPRCQAEAPAKKAFVQRALAPTSRVTAPYDALPAALRDALGPRLVTRPPKAGQPGTQYAGVSRQGAGYQVQVLCAGRTVRLATVSDPRVGALLVAASRLDARLLEAPLKAREWLLQLCRCPDEAARWADVHVGSE